jgi:hypothetical protein
MMRNDEAITWLRETVRARTDLDLSAPVEEVLG